MRILQTAILTALGGLLIALVLFVLTSPAPRTVFLPVGRPDGTGFVTDFGGTDQWTGEVQPVTQSWTDPTGKRMTKVYALSPEDKNYRAIPMPVGFVVGSLLTLGLIVILGRRRTVRTSSPPLVAG